MNLSRIRNEELFAELQARADGVAKYDPLPVDSTKNHLLLDRDNLGRFKKRK